MNAIKKLGEINETGNLMPVIFFGHGSPMNGIEENRFTEGWKKSIEGVPAPRAIVVISAHWETLGTKVTAMARPRTIHDFGGFPKELFETFYNAPGDPDLAGQIAAGLKDRLIELDESWGLDHGTWTVLRHLYPDADIPVLQLSLDRHLTPAGHYDLAKDLQSLRRKGVLIAGSGNVVHNLRRIDFRETGGFDWAESANNKFKNLILTGEHDKLIKYESLGQDVALSVPTPEHYLPLLYILGLKNEGEHVELFNDAVELGSIAMTGVKIGMRAEG